MELISKKIEQDHSHLLFSLPLFSSTTEKFSISVSLLILYQANLIQPDCFLTSVVYISNNIYAVGRQRKGVAETKTENSLTCKEWSELVLEMKFTEN